MNVWVKWDGDIPTLVTSDPCSGATVPLHRLIDCEEVNRGRMAHDRGCADRDRGDRADHLLRR